MKFVRPDLRARENVFYWQDDPSKIQQGRKSGKLLKVGIPSINGSDGSYYYWLCYLSGKYKQNLGDLEKRWICKNFQTRVSEQEHLFNGSLAKDKQTSGKCFQTSLILSAIFDRQGLLVAALIDLRTKKAEKSTPQLLQGFWYKLMKQNPKIVGMLPTVATKSYKQQ